MNEIEQAIKYLQPIADSATVGHYGDMLGIALAALREQAEREKGCVWCKGDWTDNFTVIDENFCQPLTYRHVKYCPMCGAKMSGGADNGTA